MNKVKEQRAYSTIAVQQTCRVGLSDRFRPQSSSLLVNNISRHLQSHRKSLSQHRITTPISSVWRTVSAANCQQKLKEQLTEPIRKHLSQKRLRLFQKRKQQQKQYDGIVSMLHRKTSLGSNMRCEQFKQIHKLINNVQHERQQLNKRYHQRLLKLVA